MTTEKGCGERSGAARVCEAGIPPSSERDKES